MPALARMLAYVGQVRRGGEAHRGRLRAAERLPRGGEADAECGIGGVGTTTSTTRATSPVQAAAGVLQFQRTQMH